MSVRGKLGTKIPETKEEWQTRERFRFRCQAEINNLAAASQAQGSFAYSEKLAGPLIASRICFLKIDCAEQLESLRDCITNNDAQIDPKSWPWAKNAEELAAASENTKIPAVPSKCENLVNSLRSCVKGGKSL